MAYRPATRAQGPLCTISQVSHVDMTSNSSLERTGSTPAAQPERWRGRFAPRHRGRRIGTHMTGVASRRSSAAPVRPHERRHRRRAALESKERRYLLLPL